MYARFLDVSDGLSAVDDVVERWVDARATALPAGSVSGVVVDAVSGAPLPDTNVTLGGLHIATDYADRFTFRDVAAGNQRITAHRDLHDYGMGSLGVSSAGSGVAHFVHLSGFLLGAGGVVAWRLVRGQRPWQGRPPRPRLGNGRSGWY